MRTAIKHFYIPAEERQDAPDGSDLYPMPESDAFEIGTIIRVEDWQGALHVYVSVPWPEPSWDGLKDILNAPEAPRLATYNDLEDAVYYGDQIPGQLCMEEAL